MRTKRVILATWMVLGLGCSAELEATPTATKDTLTSDTASDTASDTTGGAGIGPETAGEVATPDVKQPSETSACATNACPSVGATACDGSTRLECVAGSDSCLDWKQTACNDGDPCTKDACDGGKCTTVFIPSCVTCAPGATRCAADAPVIETCQPDKSTWKKDGTLCQGACAAGKCVSCAPGKDLCDKDVLTSCGPDGETMTPVETCTKGCLAGPTGAACAKCVAAKVGCASLEQIGVCQDPVVGYTATATCSKGVEACMSGACKGVLSWTSGDTQDDALLWFAIHAAACFAKPSRAPTRLCWVLDTTKLPLALDVTALLTWFCGGVTGGTLTASDFLESDGLSAEQLFTASKDLFGCAPDAVDLDLGTGLAIGSPLGALCMSRDNKKKIVQVAPCPSDP